MTDEQWNEYKKRSKDWNVKISFGLLHSKAYQELDYCPAVKVLNWFFEKIKGEWIAQRKGKQKRFQMTNNGEISFPYREAEHRGLSHQQFNKALRELHRVGFLDVTKPGSALKGDYSRFALSARWREYGTATFEAIEFPQSVHWVNFGYGSTKRSKIRQKREKKNLGMRTHT